VEERIEEGRTEGGKWMEERKGILCGQTKV
jgi:hypothetical protein